MLKYNRTYVQVEVWQGTMAESYEPLLKANWLVDAGTYDIKSGGIQIMSKTFALLYPIGKH